MSSSTSACASSERRCVCYTQANYQGDAIIVGGDDVALANANECAFGCEDQGSWEYFCFDVNNRAITLDGDAGASSKPEAEVEITDTSGALYTPNLIVDIPGLNLEENIGYDDKGNIASTLLPAYVSGVYKFLVPLMAMVAVVILMVGGIQYILAHGNMDQVKKAQSRMSNAVVGLILLLAAYNIGFLIDPNVVKFGALTIESIEEEPIEVAESIASYGTVTEISDADTVTIASSGHLTVIASDKRAGTEVYEELMRASDAFFDATGKNLVVTSASRTVQRQAELYYQYCVAASCSNPTCNPARNSSLTMSQLEAMSQAEAVAALVANGDAGACNHTNNSAVDIWPEGSEKKSFDVEDMNAMTSAMEANGFCRLDSEPWHFELIGHESSTCNYWEDSSYTRAGKKYSTSGCIRWNGELHTCERSIK